MDNETQEFLKNLDAESLEELLAVADAISTKSTDKPQNDDELHSWIKTSIGLDIPRVAVCSGHNAPFEPIADLFFRRTQSAIVMANRGGAKTSGAAVWHILNMKFTPGAECISVAAQEIQATRAYQYFKKYQKRAAADLVDTSLRSETRWKGGEKLEILTGSFNSVNGPHVPFVHRDEVELMDRGVYYESQGIETSTTAPDGTIIHPQSLITSTRKTSFDLMQELLDECNKAIKEGRKPPHSVYVYCIKECVQNQPRCRVAFPNLPEEEQCNCDEIQSGEWDEGKPRTMDQVCGGAFSKSKGFKSLEEVQKTFVSTSKAMWDAQYECKRPYAEDISLDTFSTSIHGVIDYEPDPNNGFIFNAIDVGGTSPHAVEWMQLLDFEIEVKTIAGEIKRIPEGSIVVFDELYKAEIGNTELIEEILLREVWWRNKYPDFRVHSRFVDPQAKTMRLDCKHHDPPLICSWPAVTRDREEHLKRTRTRVNNRTFYIDVERCPMFIEEVSVWNINKRRKAFDHAVDSTLYGVSNIHSLIEIGIDDNRNEVPTVIPRKVDTMPAVRITGPEGELFKEDMAWRGRLWTELK